MSNITKIYIPLFFIFLLLLAGYLIFFGVGDTESTITKKETPSIDQPSLSVVPTNKVDISKPLAGVTSPLPSIEEPEEEITEEVIEEVISRYPKVNFTFEGRYSQSKPRSLDSFGDSIVMNDNFVFVTSPFDDKRGLSESGSVNIFKLEGAKLNLVQELKPEDIKSNERFGHKLAANNNVLAVTAEKANETGAVYIYELANNTWNNTQKILPKRAINKSFGGELYLTDKFLVIGEPRGSNKSDGNEGLVHIYERRNNSWQLKQTLNSPAPQLHNQFGSGLLLKNKLLFVGELEGDDIGTGIENGGAVHIYKQRLTGKWSLVKTILNKSPDLESGFGERLDLENDHLFVSAPNEYTSRGGIYIYKILENGSLLDDKRILASTKRISPKEAPRSSLFGLSFDAEGDFLLVGSPLASKDKEIDSGRVYLFRIFDKGIALNEVSIAESEQNLEADNKSEDRFGHSISLKNKLVFVGSRRGDSEEVKDSGNLKAFSFK